MQRIQLYCMHITMSIAMSRSTSVAINNADSMILCVQIINKPNEDTIYDI